MNDKDLDGLGQLNFYRNQLFKSLFDQESYHTMYLDIMNHTATSKAPNFVDYSRESLVRVYMRENENMNHIFPEIVAQGDNIKIIFRRKKHKDNCHTLMLSELNENNID